MDFWLDRHQPPHFSPLLSRRRKPTPCILSPSLFCCCCFLNVTRRAPSCILAASHLLAFFLRCFAAAATRTWLYVGFLGDMEARKARCASCHDLEVCVCVLLSALDDGAFSNFSTHPGWLRLRVLLLPLPAVCRGHSEVGRGAGCGRLAGRQNLRGNKTTVCV